MKRWKSYLVLAMASSAVLLPTIDSDSAERVERMADTWGHLVNERDEEAAQTLHREILSLKNQAAGAEMTDLHSVCQRVEELVLLAHRRHYDVPEEMFLTVSMAMEFIGFLVSTPTAEARAKADVQGFIAQLEAVLQDAESLPNKERRPISYAAPSSSRYLDGTAEHLAHGTRVRLSKIATEIFLESIRSESSSALRLRENWQALQHELTRLGRVRLKDRLVVSEEQIAHLAPDKQIHVGTEIQDVIVSPEIAVALEIALAQLIGNAVTHGIETPPARIAAGKPAEGSIRVDARITDGAAVLSIEDDGAGVDTAAILRTALDQRLVSSEESDQNDPKLAFSLMFEPGVSGSFNHPGDGLATVRDVVKRAGGTIEVRSVPSRGTSLTVTIPDATTNVEVRTFRSPSGHVLLAIEASWALANEGPATPLDLMSALQLPQKGSVPRMQKAIFRRGKSAYEVPTRSTPILCVASRLSPTHATAPVEVILVGTAEGLLLRLDQIVDRMSQSTVPPPAESSRGAATTALGGPSFDPSASTPARRGAQRVLLVDSNPTWLVLTRSALLHRGFAVHAVSTLLEMDDALDKWGPDVILADVQSLEKPAVDVCQHVKKLRPLLPLILFSETNVEATDDLVRDALAEVSLSKTLGPDQLALEITRRCNTNAAL